MARNDYSDLGAVLVDDDYSDLGAVAVEDEPPILTGEQLEGFRTQEIQTKQNLLGLQNVLQQAQKIAELNPINWTAKQVQHYYKKNPPGNVQEQAQANAAFELKKRQENALTSQIVGEEPPEITPRPVDINIPGAVIDRISKSPLIQNLKTIPLAGPVSPGFIESQIAPGRAILAPYAELAKETPFKLAGVTALPFVDPEIFYYIYNKL